MYRQSVQVGAWQECVTKFWHVSYIYIFKEVETQIDTFIMCHFQQHDIYCQMAIVVHHRTYVAAPHPKCFHKHVFSVLGCIKNISISQK